MYTMHGYAYYNEHERNAYCRVWVDKMTVVAFNKRVSHCSWFEIDLNKNVSLVSGYGYST